MIRHLAPLLPPAALLCLSAFFSGSETALFSLSREMLTRFAQSSNRAERLIARMLGSRKDLLITILFGNMVVNVLLFSYSVLISRRYLDSGRLGAASAVGICTLVAVIVFGEVTPKTIGVHYPARIARFAIIPLSLVHRAVLPVRFVLGALVDFLTGLFPSGNTPDQVITPEELKVLVDLSRRNGLLALSEQQMIESVVDLSRVPVREAMVPRVDAPLFNLGDGRTRFLDIVRRTREKHVLAYEGSIDRIVGLIPVKDALRWPEKPLRDLVRPVPFIPESASLETLLAELRKQKRHLAVVVDEYGGTAGYVTIEDVMEEVVGEIEDEYEQDGEPVVQVDERTYLLAGNVSVREWDELFAHSPIGDSADFTTLAGFVTALLGHLPRVGETVSYLNLMMTIEQMSEHRIERVRVTLMGQPNESDSAANTPVPAGRRTRSNGR